MNRAMLLRSFRRSEIDPNLEQILHARRAVMITGPELCADAGLEHFVPTDSEDLFAQTKQHAERAAEAEPTAAHRAITVCQERLKAAGGYLSVFTLNTDDLHERVNSQVHHVMGQLSWEVCTSCEMRSPAMHRAGECGCGGRRRPDLILANEEPRPESEQAFARVIRNAQALICVGTPGNSEIVRFWSAMAGEQDCTASLLVAAEPDPEFAALFDVVVDEPAEEVRHYLPR